MFYSIIKKNKSYICIELKKRNNNPLSKTWEAQKDAIMKKNDLKRIAMLQYRIQRYQSMRNGAMCQTLNAELNKLLQKEHTF